MTHFMVAPHLGVVVLLFLAVKQEDVLVFIYGNGKGEFELHVDRTGKMIHMQVSLYEEAAAR